MLSLNNAGVCLHLGGQSILVDALEDGYPPYEGSDWELMSLPADALLFTHKHPDHFSARMVFAYLERHTQCRVFAGAEVIESLKALRVEEKRLIRLLDYENTAINDEISVMALLTRHMGAEYRHKEHYSLLLEYKAKRILFAGDAAPVHNCFEHNGRSLGHVDIMVAPYVYAMYEPAQRLFGRAMQTDVLALNHIPQPDNEEIRACLHAIPASARAYKMIVTERNTQMEVD